MRARLLASLAFFVWGIAQASASILYNVLTSEVAFSPSNTVHPVPYTITGPLNSVIVFETGSVPVIVGDATPNAAATVTIIYEVDARQAFPVSQITATIQGSVVDLGRIQWTEIVETLGGQLVDQVSGSVLGGSYPGGSNGSFIITPVLNISPALTQYRVKKIFTLDIDGAQLPSNSLASLGFVEQHAVPEPATWACLAGGIAWLLRRRRSS
jgi:hypothetical protein